MVNTCCKRAALGLCAPLVLCMVNFKSPWVQKSVDSSRKNHVCTEQSKSVLSNWSNGACLRTPTRSRVDTMENTTNQMEQQKQRHKSYVLHFTCVQLSWLAILIVSIFFWSSQSELTWFAFGPSPDLYIFGTPVRTWLEFSAACVLSVIDRTLNFFTRTYEEPTLSLRHPHQHPNPNLDTNLDTNLETDEGEFQFPARSGSVVPFLDRIPFVCTRRRDKTAPDEKTIFMHAALFIEILFMYSSVLIRAHIAWQQLGLFLWLVFCEWVNLVLQHVHWRLVCRHKPFSRNKQNRAKLHRACVPSKTDQKDDQCAVTGNTPVCTRDQRTTQRSVVNSNLLVHAFVHASFD